MREMWGRCVVCGTIKKDAELAAIALHGRRTEACAACAREAGLPGPECFSERPDLVEGLAKRLKRGKRKGCMARLEALRRGLFPEPEQVREWVTLAKADFEGFKAKLSSLPLLADKLLILVDMCGLNGFDACAVLLGWQKALGDGVVPSKEKIARAVHFLKDHGFPGETAKNIATNVSKCFALLYQEAIEWEEARKKEREEAARRQEEEKRKRAEKVRRLGEALKNLHNWGAEAAEALLKDLEAKTSLKPRTKGEAEVARRASRLLNALEDPGSSPKDLLKALAAYAGKREKSLPEWAEKVARLGHRVFAGPEVRREFERMVREREAEARHRAELATEKEVVKSLRRRLDALGVTEPLTLDRYEKFRRMLPERLAELLRLKHRYILFGWKHTVEPSWISEPPDETVFSALEAALPDRLLARAWNDRWVTVKTAAETLGVSPNRIRSALSELPHIKVENPHGGDSPMRLIRLSSLLDWAERHREKVARWAAASARAREAHRRAFERKVRELREAPRRLAGSPAVLACFWLSLLNRAAKSGMPDLYGMKDAALKELVKAGVPFELAFVEGGDREEKVWLCDECLEKACEMGLHPLEYIDTIGPCGDCDVEPAVDGYYDLYELTFTFPGAGRFCFHVPYPIGKKWLPDPASIPDGQRRFRGEEGGFLFGRPLNKVEREAFSVEEIVAGLRDALGRLAGQREGENSPAA